MNDKNNQDENIGVTAIIIIIVLAVIGFYYFFSHRPPGALKPEEHPDLPLTPSAQITKNLAKNSIVVPLMQ